MGHVESFSLLQISRTSSAPRFASLLQSIEAQRLVGPRDGAICHITRPVSFVHRTELLPSRDMRPRALPGAREAPGRSTCPYRACDSAGPDTSGATRLLRRCRQTTVKVEVVGESCGHLQRPGSPCHRGIRTSTGLTERLGSLERCPHRQARGRCLFSTSVPFVTTLDSHPTCSLVCVLYTLCWPGVVPLVPTVSLSSVSTTSPCLHPMATPLCLGGAL